MKKINFLKWIQQHRFLTYLTLSLNLLLFTNLLQAKNSPINQLVIEKKAAGFEFNTIDLLEIDIHNARKTDVQQFVSGETLLQINQQKVTELMRTNINHLTLNIPHKKGIMELELIQHEVVADDFMVKIEENGREIIVNYNSGIHYRGIIKGEQHSMAAISIFDDRIIGGIFNRNKEYILGPVDDSEQNKTIQHIFYDAADLRIRNNFVCDIDDSPDKRMAAPSQMTPTAKMLNVDNCVQVYFECTHQTYQDKGLSVSNTANYVIGIYNLTALIYQNENINTIISEIFVWTSPDSYSTASSEEALADFRAEVGSTFNGDVAHLLTTGNDGNGGRAMVDVLCDKSLSHAYSNIDNTYNNFPTYSWTVMVVTHEIGHNLGPWHTHNCEWNGDDTAIDGCGPEAGFYNPAWGCPPSDYIPPAGTIMSYCHRLPEVGIDLTLGFHPQVGDLIRDRVYNATCLNICHPCPTYRAVFETYNDGHFADLEADKGITSFSTLINSGADVTFDAGDEITLLPGFDAQMGCLFLGIIDGCDGAYKATTAPPKVAFQAQTDLDIMDIKCYPNPFSESTTLSYTLSSDQSISLSIFNPNGQEVARLLENAEKIAGRHEVIFNGEHLPQGIYFYRFTDSTGKVHTGKIGRF